MKFYALAGLVFGSVFWAFLGTGTVPEVKQALPERVPIDPYKPAFELTYYDARAFVIAEILAKKELATQAETLMELSQLILDKSEEIGVSPSLILAMIEVESTFKPCAISSVGAKGLMQVMPYRILGRDQAKEQYAFQYHKFYDPHWNIAFGADYFGTLLQRFGSIEKALSAYNLGPTRLSYRLRANQYNGSNYARRVMQRVKKYEPRFKTT